MAWNSPSPKPGSGFKPIKVPKEGSSYPAHHIATQFGAVRPQKPEEGGAAERDMYQVQRDQDVLNKNPYGITHGKP